jgi:hypothetical protein
MVKGEGKLHTKAFGRFQDVNGNVDRVENSGLGRALLFFFFPWGSSIIIFVYNIHQTFYIKDKLCAPDSATI